MELRAYWNIVWKRWWIVALVALVVGGASVLLQPQTRESYSSAARVIAMPQIDPYRGGYAPNLERYYSVLNMELFWDDTIPNLRAGEFMEAVRRDLTPSMGGRAFGGSFDFKKEHRTLTITATADAPDIAQRMANSAARQLLDDGGVYSAQIKANEARVVLGSQAEPGFPSSRVGGTLNLGLRVVLGLIAGTALAFLLEYLDDSLRGARDTHDALGLPVLGEIPSLR